MFLLVGLLLEGGMGIEYFIVWGVILSSAWSAVHGGAKMPLRRKHADEPDFADNFLFFNRKVPPGYSF